MSAPRVALLPAPRPSLTTGDRRAVESALRELAARDGRVTPESFLSAATPEASPLHRLFEWDDGAAAHQHRLHQARQIVRTVVYRMVPAGAESRDISVNVSPAERAWVSDLADRRRESRGSLPRQDAGTSGPVAAPRSPSPFPATDVEQPRVPRTTGPRRRAVPIRVAAQDDPDLVVLQDVSGDVVGDREDFVSEIVGQFHQAEGRLAVEDLARACWDGGYNRAAHAGDHLRGTAGGRGPT